jgi:hypothetical protein
MTSQLVGTAESLGAPGKLAGVRLLTGVRANVPSLVLQTVEGPIAKRTLVRARQILANLLVGGARTLHERRQETD